MHTTFKLILVVGLLVGVGLFGYTAVAQRPSGEIAEQASPTLTGFGVAPSNVLFNATITLTVQATDISGVATVQANIFDPSNNQAATVTLYDDGGHSDGAAGNNIYGNTWTVPNNAAAGRYLVKFEANDLLGNVTPPSSPPNNFVPDGAFNVGGIGSVISSPIDGQALATASIPVQITAGDPNGLTRIELYDGTTLVGQVDASGQRATVTIDWDTHAVRGQKTIQARSVGGSGTYASNMVNLTINNCISGQQPFDDTVCTNVCAPNGSTIECMAGGESQGYCGNQTGWVYEGFDCHDQYGCCHQTTAPPTEDPDVSALTFTITDPTNGAAINTQTYTVTAQAIATADVGPSLKVRFYLDGGEVDDQFYAGDSNPPGNIYLYHSVYTLTSGTHAIRARLYDMTRYDPADSTTYKDSSVITVTVAITAPTVVIESPISNSIIGGTQAVLITADHTSNITRLALYDANAGFIGEFVPNPASPHLLRESINWNTTTYIDGMHQIYAVAYSGSQTGYSATIPVIVDNQNPTITFSKAFEEAIAKDNHVGGGSNAQYPSKIDGTVIVDVDAADSGAGIDRVEFYLDGVHQATVRLVPYQWVWASDKITNGNYKLSAKVFDRSGKSATTAELTVVLDHCAFVSGGCTYSDGYECCLNDENTCLLIGKCK